MTQAELAKKAKTTQSAIARVENGGRSPTVAYMERLLSAMGEELRLDSGPKRRRRRGKEDPNILYKPR